MKKLFLLAATILFTSAPIFATDNIDTAKRFIRALEAGDMAIVAGLIGKDGTFEDPTFGASHKGRDTLLRIYEGYRGGGTTHDLFGYVTNAYESSETVVLTYMVYAAVDLVAGGKAADRLPLMGQIIRVIGFKDGKIIRHTDLANYSRILATIAAARKARASQ
ncbi:MAG: nuclear transport factor 2 family protein [Kordiimonadaceae bacterium]|nr:nuclear transport factor 2 family protein [Kordiimonadaceae bacterium]